MDERAELCDRRKKRERERRSHTKGKRGRESKSDMEREEWSEMEIVIFYQQNFEWFNVLYEMMDTPVTERVMIEIGA